jgi:hypothetical protein
MVKTVHIMASKLYFDKVFEPKRKALEKQLGIKISQPRLTEYLARKELGIKYPTFKNIPKQFRKTK